MAMGNSDVSSLACASRYTMTVQSINRTRDMSALASNILEIATIQCLWAEIRHMNLENETHDELEGRVILLFTAAHWKPG